MARAKANESRKAKSNIGDELTQGMAKLRELSAQIEDLGRDGFPYREASRARTELSLRETIRRLFGEKSPEYHAHKHHKLRVGSRAESAQSIALIKQLITALESQKADLLGLKSSVLAETARAALERPALTSVPLNAPHHLPTEQTTTNAGPLDAATMTNLVAHGLTTPLPTTPVQRITPVVATASLSVDALPVPPPSVASLESTSTASRSHLSDSSVINSSDAVKAVPPSVRQDEASSRIGPPAQTVSSCPGEEMNALKPHSDTRAAGLTAALEPTPILQPTMPARSKRPELTARTPAFQSEPPTSSSVSSNATSMAIADSAMVDQSGAPSTDTSPELGAVRKIDTETAHRESVTLDALRRVCTRFHLVARQLRLRKEYRPTLEITDEYDLQDLFYALLRLQFDEVGTEEWTPDYTNDGRRTRYLLDWDRTVVVVKLTRSGLTTKDLAEQVKADAAHYAARPDGTTLLCFIYDPDGRVGNPRGLEADLTTVSDNYMVEVIVAPK